MKWWGFPSTKEKRKRRAFGNLSILHLLKQTLFFTEKREDAMQMLWRLAVAFVFSCGSDLACKGMQTFVNHSTIRQHLQALQADDSSNFHPTQRVSPKTFDNSTCISSKTKPILISRAVQCPCFIHYTIGSDERTVWDVFVVPSSALTTWQSLNYSGNPGNIAITFSNLKQTTTGVNSYLVSDNMNAYLNGSFHLAIRTNTAEKRCFNSVAGALAKTSIVFESMPPTCKILTGEPTPRIVGGIPVTDTNSPDHFRWMALIWKGNNRPVCGGSLIAPGYVLTAAHCHIQLDLESYSVRLGTLQADRGKSYGISRAFTHPRYHQLASNEAINDITILELIGAEERTHTIAWNGNDSIPTAGDTVTTAGFGYISEEWTALPEPNRLLRVDVPVVSRERCEQRFPNVEEAVHLCAGFTGGGCDSCQSDSGGPLRYVMKGTNGSIEQRLVGIVSFGSGCARSENPGVYTRVSGFRRWINETLDEAMETRGGEGFLQNRAAVGGVVGGIVVVVVVVIAMVVLFLRRKGISGGGEVREEREGSSMPSTTGISV